MRQTHATMFHWFNSHIGLIHMRGLKSHSLSLASTQMTFSAHICCSSSSWINWPGNTYPTIHSESSLHIEMEQTNVHTQALLSHSRLAVRQLLSHCTSPGPACLFTWVFSTALGSCCPDVPSLFKCWQEARISPCVPGVQPSSFPAVQLLPSNALCGSMEACRGF